MIISSTEPIARRIQESTKRVLYTGADDSCGDWLVFWRQLQYH